MVLSLQDANRTQNNLPNRIFPCKTPISRETKFFRNMDEYLTTVK